jgi:hypothetical protein
MQRDEATGSGIEHDPGTDPLADRVPEASVDISDPVRTGSAPGLAVRTEPAALEAVMSGGPAGAWIEGTAGETAPIITDRQAMAIIVLIWIAGTLAFWSLPV